MLLPLSLFVLQLLLNLLLVYFFNSFQPLTYEESHSSFVNILYFEHRLQASEFASSFGAYLLYWLGFTAHPDPGLLYGRTIKAIYMALTAPATFMILRQQSSSKLYAVLAALVLGLIPGIYQYTALGIDIGLELPIGLCAMAFATLSRPIAAGLVLMLACLTYGAGLAFIPPVAAILATQPNPLRKLTITAASATTLLVAAIVYWSNVQVLFLGGGGGAAVTLRQSIGVLRRDLLSGAGSYYYQIIGHPALGPNPLPLLAIAAFFFAAYHYRQFLPWLLLALASFLIAAFSGAIPGTRRAIPLVAALIVITVLSLQQWSNRWPRLQLATALLLFGLISFDAARVANQWRTRSANPIRDFRLFAPGANTEEILEAYRLRLAKPPEPRQVFHPRAHFAILNMLTRPDPIVSFEQAASVEDQADPPFHPDVPRFSKFFEILDKRRQQKSTSSAAQ